MSILYLRGSDGEFYPIESLRGTDGTSPAVSVAAITGGNRITITDVNGSKTVDVMNGKDGANGTSAYDYAKIGGYTGTEEDFAYKLAMDSYSKDEIDAIMGAYVDDIDVLLGGDS